MGREGPTYLHEAPGLGKVPHDEPRAAPPRAREDVLPVAGDLHVEVQLVAQAHAAARGRAEAAELVAPPVVGPVAKGAQ